MKKILLVSMFQNVSNILKLVEKDIKGKTITYIITASKVEKLGFLIRMSKWILKSLGLIIDELDISNTPYETIKSKLENNDYIFVTGGNTFFLLQELKRTKTDKIIINEVNKGKLYIGESAGAIVVSPSIEYSKAMDSIEKAPNLKDFTGLHLVNFYTVPHDNNWEFKKAVREIVDKYSKTLELSVINDKQAILIENDKIKILSK